jgi:hypothetical protein
MRESIVTSLGTVTAALLTVSVVIGAVPMISQKSYAQTRSDNAGTVHPGLGAIAKFKQHKDNPTQIPLGSSTYKVGINPYCCY